MRRVRRNVLGGIICLAVLAAVATRLDHERRQIASSYGSMMIVLGGGRWDVQTIPPPVTGTSHPDDHVATGMSPTDVNSEVGNTIYSSTNSTRRNVTFVVHLAGELGNHLYYVSRGIALAELARRTRFHLVPTILFQQQTRRNRRTGQMSVLGKAVATERDLKRCFPWFRHFSFGFGNSEQYSQMKRLQADLMMMTTATTTTINASTTMDHGKDAASASSLWMNTKGLDSHDMDKVWSAMNSVADIAPIISSLLANHNASFATASVSSYPTSGVPLSLPLLDVTSMSPFFAQFQEPLRRAFAFDDDRCCRVLPDADETVFHYRNFLAEMPKKGKRMGFQEMSPVKVATELFRDKVEGDKIAIVTRIHDGVVSDIVQLLEGRGLQVRVIGGQTGVEDWCFMKHTTKELVGGAISSFVKWAAFLGNATTTRLYFLDSPWFRQRTDLEFLFQEALYLTKSNLKSRIRYEMYRSEDIDDHIETNGNVSERLDRIYQMFSPSSS